MSSSFFARKVVMCCCLAVALPAIVSAQPACNPTGSEYAVAGSLPGDQTRPALSLSTSGGYLVWEDNSISSKGLGIRAAALDGAFSHVLSPFKVNKNNAGDQEHPQVALLNNGGAVFVWQGGRQGFQHIYARFISSTNTWATSDVLVNSSSTAFQLAPAVAALSNGNVIVVYSSRNQVSANSMLDVYGQLFSPNGQKIGGEFLVNQFTSFNQRTPAVAALTGGGFAVAWVSEQQRILPTVVSNSVDPYTLAGQLAMASALPHPSVDVMARLYAADSTPAGDEFLVNTGNDPCANPALAVGADGGFVIAWSQKNVAVTDASWDVMARRFASDASGGGVVTVNTYLYGDQFGPQVSAVGTEYLVIWTSLGQDGSREGVFGQLLTGDGSPDGGEFRVNTTTANRQMQPAVASDSYGRFLAVWTSYVGGGNSFDLYAQLYTSTNFVPPTTSTFAYSPPFDATAGNPLGDGGTTPSANNTSGTNAGSNPMALAYPVTAPFSAGGSNGFSLAKGAYNGLFYDTNGVAVSSSGYFTATTTDRGAYTARLTMGSRAYSFSGQFDASGLAAKVISRGAGLPALSVKLQLDLAGGDQMRGHVSSGGWSAELVSDRQVLNKSTSAGSKAGNYTLVIPADENSPNSPAGDGIGVVTVDKSGNVQWSGTLADGTKVNQKSTISKQGVWPLYYSLYSGGGSVIAWMQFNSQTDSDLGGQLIWTKPGAAGTKYYPAGFTNTIWALGSAYTAPLAGQRVLDLNHGDGNLIFYGGGLAAPFTNILSLDLRNRVTTRPADHLSLSFTPASGLLRGSTLNPFTGKTISFQGVLFEKEDLGVGFFLGPSQSGGFYLSPAP